MLLILLSLQLILTGGIIALFMLLGGLKDYTEKHTWIQWSAFSVTIVSIDRNRIIGMYPNERQWIRLYENNAKLLNPTKYLAFIGKIKLSDYLQ